MILLSVEENDDYLIMGEVDQMVNADGTVSIMVDTLPDEVLEGLEEFQIMLNTSDPTVTLVNNIPITFMINDATSVGKSQLNHAT